MNDDGEGDGLAYDSESSSVIKLNNGLVLYLREVNKYVVRWILGLLLLPLTSRLTFFCIITATSLWCA